MKEYINELLHIDDINNKLIHLDSGSDPSSTIYLKCDNMDTLASRIIKVIVSKIGRPANTALIGSSKDPDNESMIGEVINAFDWVNRDGKRNNISLDKYISETYKNFIKKGTNPFFLSIGSLTWDIKPKDEIITIKTPFLLFPVKLIRNNSLSPFYIEFLKDDIYVNPCLIAKLTQVHGEELVKKLPLFDKCEVNFDDAINIDNDDIDNKNETVEKFISYLRNVEDFIYKAGLNNKGGHFEFETNCVAIASYNHDEICMYYDIKNHLDDIMRDELVNRIFNKCTPEPAHDIKLLPDFILDNDTNQASLITSIVNGDNMIIKGPPGTGKTLSIANIVATLMNAGKNVLVTSKKLAALQEVYDKMPENLRKYILLLDSDSEAQAANITTTSIKRSLSEVVFAAKSLKVDQTLRNRKANSVLVKKKAIDEMREYTNILFGAPNYKAFDHTLYELLDEYFVDESVPVIDFDNDVVIRGFSNEELGDYNNRAESLGKFYEELSNNYEISIFKSPLFGISNSTPIDELFNHFDVIKKNNEVFKEFNNELIEDASYNVKNLPIVNLECLLKDALIEEEYDNAYEKINVINRYIDDLDNLYNATRHIKLSSFRFVEEANILSKDAKSFLRKLDTSLTLKGIRDLFNCKSLFASANGYRDNEFVGKVIEQYNHIDEVNKEIGEHLDKFFNVFRKDLTDENYKELETVVDALKDYDLNTERITGLFSGKAKKAEAKAREFIFIPETSFKELNGAIKEYASVIALNQKIKEYKNNIYRLFQKSLSDDEIASIRVTVEFVSKFHLSVSDCFDGLDKYFVSIEEAFKKFFDEGEGNVGTLISCIECNELSYSLSSILNKIFDNKVELKRIQKVALALIGFKGMYDAIGDKYSKDSFLSIVKTIASIGGKYKINERVKEVLDIFRYLKDKLGIVNFYTTSLVTFGDLDILLDNAYNDYRIGSAITISDECKQVLFINDFVTKFDKLDYEEKIKGFSKVLKKSYVQVGINAILDKIGNKRFSLVKDNEDNIRKLSELNHDIERANAKIIEENICKSINPDDTDFKFSEKQNDKSTPTRFLFRDNANAIIKLKRCIIASPSTVSLLMRTFPQNIFDCVIVDEASQLEPVCAIPVAFRSRQMVIVGDEWQMPPIKHFQLKNESKLGDDEEALEAEISVLALALKNTGFRLGELQCHYRSETESLIKFSKERFYKDYMNTFPATVPMKDGLGFVDVRVNGTCVDGVNPTEAQEALNLIRKHFNRYMNEDGVLTETLGVVTFGVKQLDAIKRLVDNDKDLTNQINRARMHKLENQTDDKVFFFRTIEKVQGQEADHLILSFTYGVNESGKTISRFGELNRNDLGQCIFNVAVTRAKKSISIIHSFDYTDIKDEKTNVGYIKEYLRIAYQFSKGGKDQFLSKKPNPGFLMTVGKFIASVGVPEDRIVYNYGVTDGSIRIPIAVLSEDYNRALFGLWVEPKFNTMPYKYLDYETTYFDTLVKKNKWDMKRIDILEWYGSNDTIKQELSEFAKKHILD